MPMFPIISNPFQRYSRRMATLRGHNGPVMSVAFSPNGKYIATGGADGIMIWETKSWKIVTIPKQSYVERAQVSCVCWVTRRNEAIDTLCYGNALRFLVFLQYCPTESRFETVHSSRVAKGGEIVYVATHTSITDVARIAICTRDKCLQVWTFDAGSCKLSPVFSKVYTDEKNVFPKTLAFDNNPDHDLFVFGLYDGNLYKYGGKDAVTISKHQLGTRIGHAAVDTEHRLCVVDNVGDGYDIYKLDSGTFVRTLTTKDPVKTYPKGVAFASQSHAIVGGSDHGHVYIFDRKTGKVITMLQHARSGGAEIIATYDTSNGSVLIATASSTADSGHIHIWKWTPERKTTGDGLMAVRIMVLLFKTAIFVAGCAYFYEIFKQQVARHAFMEFSPMDRFLRWKSTHRTLEAST